MSCEFQKTYRTTDITKWAKAVRDSEDQKSAESAVRALIEEARKPRQGKEQLV